MQLEKKDTDADTDADAEADTAIEMVFETENLAIKRRLTPLEGTPLKCFALKVHINTAKQTNMREKL